MTPDEYRAFQIAEADRIYREGMARRDEAIAKARADADRIAAENQARARESQVTAAAIAEQNQAAARAAMQRDLARAADIADAQLAVQRLVSNASPVRPHEQSMRDEAHRVGPTIWADHAASEYQRNPRHHWWQRKH